MSRYEAFPSLTVPSYAAYLLKISDVPHWSARADETPEQYLSFFSFKLCTSLKMPRGSSSPRQQWTDKSSARSNFSSKAYLHWEHRWRITSSSDDPSFAGALEDCLSVYVPGSRRGVTIRRSAKYKGFSSPAIHKTEAAPTHFTLYPSARKSNPSYLTFTTWNLHKLRKEVPTFGISNYCTNR